MAAGEGSSRVTAMGDQAPAASSLAIPHAGDKTLHLSDSSPAQLRLWHTHLSEVIPPVRGSQQQPGQHERRRRRVVQPEHDDI